MKMNKLALACGVAMLGLSSIAAAEVSMNVGVTSNYIWRGLTQTGGDTAFSGGVDWEHGSGLYAGAWVSEAWDDYELDLYGGYGGSFGDFEYGVGLTYYSYTSECDCNFAEIGFSGGWKMLSFGIDYTVTSDISDTSGGDEFPLDGDMHYYVGASFDLPQDMSIGGTIGQYTFEDDGVASDMDYTYFQVDLTKSVGDFGDVTFSVSDTNLDVGDALAGTVADTDPRFFVSWSKGF